MSKVTIIGGGGIRTPLIIHGLAQARQNLGVNEIALYDTDRERLELIATLGREVARGLDGEVKLTTPARLESAVEGASFVISSIRVGGIAARARDERLAIEHGIAGQETMGFGGLAMALRTVPVALEHAQTVERLAIRAAIERSKELAKLALLTYPVVGQWRPANELIEALKPAV